MKNMDRKMSAGLIRRKRDSRQDVGWLLKICIKQGGPSTTWFKMQF